MIHSVKTLRSLRQEMLRMTPRLTLKRLLWLILAIGVLLRTVQYVLDMSLWIDEAFISLNIIERSWAELLQPLSYRQGAPLGFLALEKLAVTMMGTSEWALRLFPFLAGVASLGLFQAIAVRLMPLSAATIAVGLFAISDRLIYYSAEVKQYSSDVAITLLLCLVLIPRQAQFTSWRRYLLMAIVGGLAIWCSHPAVLVLAGMGCTLFLSAIHEQSWEKVRGYLGVFTVWLASFAAFYFISLRSLIGNEALQKSFETGNNAFMPLPPTSLADFDWFVQHFFSFFDYPVGLPLIGLATLCFMAGIYSLWQQDKSKLFLLISPILMTLLASGLHQYPFEPRLMLFAVPLTLLVLAAGSRYLVTKLQPNSRWIGFALIALLFFHPTYYALGSLKNPSWNTEDSSYQRVREDIKPVLAYVEQNWQAGDVVYVYYAAQYAFKYYLDRFKFGKLTTSEAVWPEASDSWFEPALPSYPPQLIVGKYSREDWSIFETELEALKGHERVWIIFAHTRDRRSSIDEEDVFLHILNRAGEQLADVSSTEASAYLYNLKNSADAKIKNNSIT